MSGALTIRIATQADLGALRDLMALSIDRGQAEVLTPAQMLRQLDRRFEFLVSRRRDGAKRHQTLYAAIDWSYRLLPPELQRFFAQLSVFRGGWSRLLRDSDPCRRDQTSRSNPNHSPFVHSGFSLFSPTQRASR